jgi:hypothetical protein
MTPLAVWEIDTSDEGCLEDLAAATMTDGEIVAAMWGIPQATIDTGAD